MIYRVKRMGLVRIMRDILTLLVRLSRVLTIESNHYFIGRKTIVVWNVSLRKPHKSRMVMRQVSIDTKHRQTQHGLMPRSLRNEGQQHVFKALYPIASRRPTFLLWAVLQLF